MATTVPTDAEGEQPAEISATELVEAVSEDEGLCPAEKETTFRFDKSIDRVHVYTEERGLMRRFLQHPSFRVTELRVNNDEVWGKRIVPNDFDGGSIAGVEGWIPIGVLVVQRSSRTNSDHVNVVSEAVLREDS